MHSSETDIFGQVKRNIDLKITPYLERFGFKIEKKEKQLFESQSVLFANGSAKISFGYSTHHLDFQDGINVTLDSGFGKFDLKNLSERNLRHQTEPYLFGLEVVDREFDRILADMKAYLEGYLNSIMSEVKNTN